MKRLLFAWLKNRGLSRGAACRMLLFAGTAYRLFPNRRREAGLSRGAACRMLLFAGTAYRLFPNRRREAGLSRGAACRMLSLLLAAGGLPAAAAPAKPSAPPGAENFPLKMLFKDDLFRQEESLLQKLNQLRPSLAAHPAAPLAAQKSAGALAKIKDSQGYGSAFIVRHEQTKAPILVTAAHAIRDSEPSDLEFFDSRGRRLNPLRVWSFSLPHDLALLELESYEGRTLKPADTSAAGGEELYMLGFPNGLQRMIKGRAVFDPSLPFFAFIADYEFLSEVHGLSQSLERKLLQERPPGNMEGVSGGPLVSRQGELKGAALSQDSSRHLLRAARADTLQKLLAHGPLKDFPSPFFLEREESPKENPSAENLQSRPNRSRDRDFPSASELPFKDQLLWLQTLLKTKGHRHPAWQKGPLSNKTLPQLRRQAEEGSASAMFLLGALLAAGFDVPRYIGGGGLVEDKQKAARWFRQAASQGHIDAQFRLAVMLWEGDGVLEDRREALRWLRKAAAAGHAEAQFHIAKAFDKGHGVRQDKKKAAYWLKKSAAQGYFPSQFRLAEMLDTGDGIRQDKKKAAGWYRQAAGSSLKNLERQLCWTGAFSCSWGLLEMEIELLFEQAQAQFRLGEMLLAGEGIPQDKKEAGRWLRLAAEGDAFKAMEWRIAIKGDGHKEGAAAQPAERAEDLLKKLNLEQSSAAGPAAPGGAFECRASFASLIKTGD